VTPVMLRTCSTGHKTLTSKRLATVRRGAPPVASGSACVQLGGQPFRRDGAVALLHPVAQQLGRGGAGRFQRDAHPAGPAQPVSRRLGAGAAERVGVGRLVRELHGHAHRVAAVVHAEEDEDLLVDLGDGLAPGGSSVAPGSPRAYWRTFSHFFRAFRGTAIAFLRARRRAPYPTR